MARFFSPKKTGAKRRTTLLPFAFCLVPLLASGCRQDMHDAPRYDPLEASTIFPKGSSAQPLVAGTVARGQLNDDEMLYTGKAGGAPVASFPFPITRADLDRGEERFNIYCSPCHGRTGDGNGMVVQRGYRRAAAFHIDRLRQAPPGYMFDVITNGFGAMPDYRAQVTAEDRWRVVAYIKALQLTHMGTTSDVPAAELEKLKSGAPAPEPAAAGHAGGEKGGKQ